MAQKDRTCQRYSDDGARQVAVAIIFSKSATGAGELGLSVHFVSCRNKDKMLTCPKGGWETFDADVVAAAQREALEEGGIRTAFPESFTSFPVRTSLRVGKKGNKEMLHAVPLVCCGWNEEFLEKGERQRLTVPIGHIAETVIVDGTQWRIKEEYVEILAATLADENFHSALVDALSCEH